MKRIILLAIGVCFGSLMAQTGYYQVPGSGSGNPGGLNDDVEYPPGGGLGSGWTDVINGAQSASWTSAQNVPFDFKFNDQTVTQYLVSTTGVLTFDVGTSLDAPTSTPEALPSASIPDNSVCLWGADLKKSGDYVISKTFGTAPNRQHWIGWYSASETGVQDGWVYCSIVLEETTNNIYLVDQRVMCVSGSSACTGKTSMTWGVQLTSSDASMVNGSDGYEMKSENNPATDDNVYYTFAPGSLPDNDATMVSVDVPQYLKLSDAPYAVSFSYLNTGGTAVSSINATYIAGTDTVTETISGLNTASGKKGMATFTTKWMAPALDKYNVEISINEVNGSADDKGMNSGSILVNVLDNFADRKILNEVFTSSTCVPCRPGNENYLSVVENKSMHSSIKYQVYWPGTGDPYCTQEVRDRAGYYGVNSVPRMEVDGAWDQNAASFTAELYDQFQSKPALIGITGSASLTWKNKITADITITPYADLSSNNYKLFAVITEGTTFWNVKSNGETEFHDVMKKMMPNSSGKSISAFTKGSAVNETLEYSFVGEYRLPNDGTTAQHINHTTENSVETWDDLKVVVFVQDATTKEVLQSETFPLAMTSIEDVENKVAVYPNPSNEAFNIYAPELTSVATIHVTNLAGQTVYNGEMLNGSAVVNTSAWNSGMYLVTLNSENGSYTTKMMVKH